MLGVDAKEQVFLKVTVAEMERNIIKQLGVDITEAIGTGAAFLTTGNLTLNKLTDLNFPFNDKDVVSTSVGSALWQTPNNQIRATVRALEQDGVIKTLAEPTLTAISGETASFLAGGEFPIPIAQDNNRVSVEFKPFGVGLAFTPIVMSEGRISMKVSTEVSEITNEAAITLSFVTIPGLKVRRAETTVELPSGGSLVIAGLISEETKQAMTGIAGHQEFAGSGRALPQPGLRETRDGIGRHRDALRGRSGGPRQARAPPTTASRRRPTARDI